MNKRYSSSCAQTSDKTLQRLEAPTSTQPATAKRSLLVAIVTLVLMMSAFVGVSMASADESSSEVTDPIEAQANEEGLDEEGDGEGEADQESDLEGEAENVDADNEIEGDAEGEAEGQEDEASSSAAAQESSSSDASVKSEAAAEDEEEDEESEEAISKSSSASSAKLPGAKLDAQADDETTGSVASTAKMAVKYDNSEGDEALSMSDTIIFTIKQGEVNPGMGFIEMVATINKNLTVKSYKLEIGGEDVSKNADITQRTDESGNHIVDAVYESASIAGKSAVLTVEAAFGEYTASSLSNKGAVAILAEKTADYDLITTNSVTVKAPAQGKLDVKYVLESGSTDKVFSPTVTFKLGGKAWANKSVKVGSSTKKTDNDGKLIGFVSASPKTTEATTTISDIDAGVTYAISSYAIDGLETVSTKNVENSISRNSTTEAEFEFGGTRSVPTKTVNKQTTTQTLASRTATFTYEITQAIPVTGEKVVITDTLDDFLKYKSGTVKVGDTELNEPQVSGKTITATVSGDYAKKNRGNNVVLTITAEFDSSKTDAAIIKKYDVSREVPNTATTTIDGQTETLDGKALKTNEVKVVRPLAKLTLAKVLSGAGVTTTDKAKSFSFTVTLQDDTGKAISGSYSGVNFSNGNATVSVKAGDANKKVIEIPSGYKYKVVEAASSKSGFTVTGEVSTATAMGEEKAVTITNTKAASTTKASSTSKSSAKTGDDSMGQIIALGAIAAVAAIALVVAFVMRRRTRE